LSQFFIIASILPEDLLAKGCLAVSRGAVLGTLRSCSNASRMRAAAILGLGTSPKDLKRFQQDSATVWIEGLPGSSEEADAILIFGGDGTIHRHLAALVRLGLPVLIVPAGSGNDFARALKLRSLSDALSVWRDFENGRTEARAIDLGVIRPVSAPGRTHYFCCVAGCGLDSAVARRASQMPRWLRSHGGYVLGLLPSLFQFPAFSMRLTQIDGERREESETPTLLAAFANTQFYGDGMRIAPQADPADGKLDVCRIHALSPFKLFCMFPTVYFGWHLWIRQVEYSRAEKVCVETETPLEIYADGEYVCETPADITVAPNALHVIAS
jgi:diacylglycerol kinase (ATP)